MDEKLVHLTDDHHGSHTINNASTNEASSVSQRPHIDYLNHLASDRNGNRQAYWFAPVQTRLKVLQLTQQLDSYRRDSSLRNIELGSVLNFINSSEYHERYLPRTENQSRMFSQLSETRLDANIHLNQSYLTAERPNLSENYLINQHRLNGQSMEPLVQLSQPTPQDTNTDETERSSTVSEPLVHLTNSQVPYTIPDPSGDTISTEPLVHLTTENGTPISRPTAEQLIEQSVQKGINFAKEIEQQRQTITEQSQQQQTPLYTHRNSDDDDDGGASLPVKPYDVQKEQGRSALNHEIKDKIKEIADELINRSIIERLIEPNLGQTLPSSEAYPIDPGIKPVDHWRGRVYNKDLHLYRDSTLVTDGNGDTTREYTYTNDDYLYLNTAKSAERSSIALEEERFATKEDHFDSQSAAFMENRAEGYLQSNGEQKFQGGHTPIVMSGDERKRKIQEYQDGLAQDEVKHHGYRPLSVLDPFTRLADLSTGNHIYTAQYANAFSYNRTRLPISDLAWRKGFRHIFITRPECYILTTDQELSKQCYYDDTFYSSYARMPHISYLLSPSYVTCRDTKSMDYGDNFNYLLSNTVYGISPSGTQLSQLESVQKSTVNATVMPGTWINSRYGNQLNLTFHDTKYLEVYECLRLWMEYIEHIYSGKFASSYNEYSSDNTYNIDTGITAEEGYQRLQPTHHHLHPYDRALDYCATIFDIVTNEAGTKILYWCKYIGVYPVLAQQNGLSDNNNQALTEQQTVSASFYYQGKEEYKMKTLVEFNYNAGIVDELGHPNNENYAFSLPYLLRTNYNQYQTHEDPDARRNGYMGAAGMFTGRPYIVLNTEMDRLMNQNKLIPQLRFMQLLDETAGWMNGGIERNVKEKKGSIEPRAAITDDEEIEA